MASRAQELFEQIKAGGNVAAQLAFLYSLAMGTAEEEYFEFKSGGLGDRAKEKEAKKYWSQALSGFSNSEGGVLIFGIKTDPTALTPGDRKIDTSTGLDLVEKPDQLLQLLKDTRLNSTVDPVQGVQYLAVKEPNGKGFVVALVPEGKNKPYRAESDSSRNYFWRIGDSFAILPHTWLRRLFYPTLECSLEIIVKVHYGNARMINLMGSIRNVGQATATNPSLIVEVNKRFDRLSGTVRFREGPVSTGIETGRQAIRVSSSEPLHPGEHAPAFDTMKMLETIRDLEGLIIRVIAYMTNQQPLYFQIPFQKDDFGQGKTAKALPTEPF